MTLKKIGEKLSNYKESSGEEEYKVEEQKYALYAHMNQVESDYTFPSYCPLLLGK